MRKLIALALLLVFSLTAGAACGGGSRDNGDTTDSSSVVGDATRGAELYRQTTIGSDGASGCITCHSVEPTDDPFQPSPVGPSHYGVASRAGDYVEGQGAEEYLRESILNPDAHIVEGFNEGVMYQNYESALTEQQVADLVAYLMTLTVD
jgi:mono/diheme cytochrome c family protein